MGHAGWKALQPAMLPAHPPGITLSSFSAPGIAAYLPCPPACLQVLELDPGNAAAERVVKRLLLVVTDRREKLKDEMMGECAIMWCCARSFAGLLSLPASSSTATAAVCAAPAACAAASQLTAISRPPTLQAS